jgi:hypothetical protein
MREECGSELAALGRMTVSQLQERYAEVFGGACLQIHFAFLPFTLNQVPARP